jgi:hypothetical protein
MTWLYYLLEANIYLMVFYGFYRAFLEQETFYGLNRTYLISASLFSFIIPFLQIGGLNQLIHSSRNIYLLETDNNLQKVKSGNLFFEFIEESLTIIYLLVATYFIIKLVISLYKIISLAWKARRKRSGGVVYIELNSPVAAFSFFHLLFINPSSEERQTILKHEMVHIRQNHSMDILFFEILKIINWFNPMVWLIQKDIKLLHEYIADEITTNADVEKHDYAMFLIKNSFGVSPDHLTNQIFNQSILKRRINMLNKQRSRGRARLRLLLAVPIVGGMLLASTMAFSKNYAMIDLYPEKYSEVITRNKQIDPLSINLFPQTRKDTSETTKQKRTAANKPVKFPPPIVRKDQVKFPPPIVKKDQIKFPPPIVKKDQVKFPPPIVKKDEIIIPPPIVVKDGDVPPPPAPRQKSSYRIASPKPGTIKFPPPIVRPNKKKLPPPPPVEPPASKSATDNYLKLQEVEIKELPKSN